MPRAVLDERARRGLAGAAGGGDGRTQGMVGSAPVKFGNVSMPNTVPAFDVKNHVVTAGVATSRSLFGGRVPYESLFEGALRYSERQSIRQTLSEPRVTGACWPDFFFDFECRTRVFFEK